MGFFIDFVVIVILLLNIALGYKKGLVNAVFSIFAFIVSVVITFILYTPVTNLIINNTEIDNNIESVIINNFSFKEEEEEKGESNNILQSYLYSNLEEYAESAKAEVNEIVAEYISVKIVRMIVAIALFAIVRIAVLLLKFVVESIAELPIIKQLNEVGGLIYGVLKGVIIILAILTILLFISSIDSSGVIISAIDNSHITKFICENIILKTIAI